MGIAKLVVFVVLFGLTGIGLLETEIGRTSQVSQQVKDQKEETLVVVRNYVALSAAGKFEDLSDITINIPQSARKRADVPKRTKEKDLKLPPGTTTVIGSEEGSATGRLEWVRKSFPQSIFESQKRIAMVAQVLVKDNLAKVSVNLGDDQRYSSLPWVFMLEKAEPGGQWKIYDIQTPAYAADYHP